MPTFDIVSEVNIQEVENAINQARKELIGRYDFRGSKAEIQWDKKGVVTLMADDEMKIKALKDIVQGRLHHRGVDIQALKIDKSEPVGGMMIKQVITIVQGIEKEKAKEIVKAIKESKIKVEAQIQGETVRVSSKSIDNLQETMAIVRGGKFGIPIQFQNMRS